MMNTIRPVLMWQQGNGQATASTELSFIENWFGNIGGNHVPIPHPVNYFLWAGSGSAYYNPANNDTNLSLTSIWGSSTFDVTQWAPYQAIDANIAATYGLHRVAYEGGPSMDYTNPKNIAVDLVKDQAWGNQRIINTITEHQALWEEYGGELLMYYQIGGTNEWAFTHSIYDPISASPKLQALDNLIQDGRSYGVTYGKSLPATWAGPEWDLANNGGGFRGGPDFELPYRATWSSYIFHTDTSGPVTVSVTYHPDTANATTFEIMVDGKQMFQDTKTAKASFTWTSTQNLPAGLHSIRFRWKSGGTIFVGNVTAR